MTVGSQLHWRNFKHLRLSFAFLALILATLVSITLSSPTAHAFGESYEWKDGNTIDGHDGALGDFSHNFVKRPMVLYPVSEAKVVDGFQYDQPVTTPDGCFVYLGIRVNATDKSKGTLVRADEPLLGVGDSACPASYSLSKHYTVTLKLENSGQSTAPPGTKVTLDVRSLISESEGYPASTDTITIKGSDGRTIAEKRVTEANSYSSAGFVGFRIQMKVTTGAAVETFTACSAVLNLCSTSKSWQSLLTAPLDIHVIEIKKVVVANQGPVCSAGALGWVICPLIELMQNITESVASLLDGLLQLNPLNESTGGGGIFKIWQSVLNVANVALVIGFLAVVFSQATSYGLSSYGAKRMLPRIIAAAILMNISFFICQALVDVSNILGAGAAQMVQVAGGSNSFSESVTQQTSGLQSVVAVSIAIAILVFFLLGPVVLGFLAVFITVAARYAIIVLLVLVAPLAFAAWILPNTEQYFKKWWKLFISMLLLYPMVMFVFAAAIIASKAVAAQANEVEGLQGSVMQIMALVVMALPLFSMPLLFKAAGGALGKLDDMTKRGARGGFDRGKKRYERTALGREAALRKQSRENARQRRYIEGKGVGGALAKGRRRISGVGTAGILGTVRPNAAAGNLSMTEQLQEQQQKLEDARTATMKTAVLKTAGLPYAPLIGQMHKGESAASFATRYKGETGEDLTGDQIAGLEGLRSKFGNQIGTTEFARAALLAGHDLGSDATHLNNATKTYANQMKADGKDDLAISNEMAGVMAQSAKAGGVYSLSGTGWSATKGYDQFGAKDSDRIISSADFTKFDSGQFGNLNAARDASGNLDLGKLMADPQHALAVSVVDQLSSPDQAVRTAMLKRVAEARGSKSFSDLAALVESTGQSSELNDMIAGFK